MKKLLTEYLPDILAACGLTCILLSLRTVSPALALGAAGLALIGLALLLARAGGED